MSFHGFQFSAAYTTFHRIVGAQLYLPWDNFLFLSTSYAMCCYRFLLWNTAKLYNWHKKCLGCKIWQHGLPFSSSWRLGGCKHSLSTCERSISCFSNISISTTQAKRHALPWVSVLHNPILASLDSPVTLKKYWPIIIETYVPSDI